MGNARKAALTALEKCRRTAAWSDAVLGSVMDAEELTDSRDRGLAAALCYGVVQNRMLLDHLIGQYSALRVQKIEPKVLDILRLSAYQLLAMDKIPASAAVNEGVKLCRSLGYPRAAGFVNAVLRKMAAQPLPIPEGCDARTLSLRYSHPLWLTELLLERFGPAETEALLRCHNGPVPITVQVNTLKTDADTLLERFAAHGLAAERHPWLPDCILLGGGDVTALPEFARGEFYVQDAAAKLAVLAAQPKPGQKILDACAAPGGKTFAAAIAAAGGAEIVSCDLHENKLKRIREGAARLGLEQISTVASDGRSFRPEWESRFDLVLADVPCSGLGVIRKKPDIREKDPADFAELPEIQSAILENVSRYVAPGGTLLYSTCTIRREENEAVAGAFLARHPEFSPEEYRLPEGTAAENGMVQLFPHRHGTDGFFIAKMRKRQ